MKLQAKKCFGRQNRNKRYNIIIAAIKKQTGICGRKFSPPMEIECLPFIPKQDIALQWTGLFFTCLNPDDPFIVPSVSPFSFVSH